MGVQRILKIRGVAKAVGEFGLTFCECPPPVGFTCFTHCKA
jgi:hypothetical protein